MVGYVLALLTQRLAYPLFGIATSLATDSAIAVIFTVVSLARSYLVRRAFAWFSGFAASRRAMSSSFMATAPFSRPRTAPMEISSRFR